MFQVCYVTSEFLELFNNIAYCTITLIGIFCFWWLPYQYTNYFITMFIYSAQILQDCSCNYKLIHQVALAMRQQKDLSVFKWSCHLHTVDTSQFSSFLPNVKQGSWEYQFFYFLVWPDRNRTRVYRFISRRSIHLTSNRFKLCTLCIGNFIKRRERLTLRIIKLWL